MPAPLPASISSLFATFALWGINFIAAELELPFGDDPNDLPIETLQVDFNGSLCVLLDKLGKEPPRFKYNPVKHKQFGATGSKEMRCRITSYTRSSMASYVEGVDPDTDSDE